MAVLTPTGPSRDKAVHRIARLDRVNEEWLIDEIQGETEEVAREENRRQTRAGNPPTRVVVDRKSSFDLNESHQRALASTPVADRLFPGLDRRISFYYTTIGALRDAFEFAYKTLFSLHSKRSGDAFGSINFYAVDFENPARTREFSRGVSGYNEVINWLESGESSDVTVYIQGPTIEYRRTAIYYHDGPGGRSKQSTYFTGQSRGYKRDPSRVGLDRYRFTRRVDSRVGTDQGAQLRTRGQGIVLRGTRRGSTARYQMLLAKAVHELVRNRVRSKFKDVRVTYRFHPGKGQNSTLPIVHSRKWRPSGENRFIPVLMLGTKKTGATRVS